MFGSRLRDLRNEKKLTQDDLGKMLNVSGKTIGVWERDSRQPNIEAKTITKKTIKKAYFLIIAITMNYAIVKNRLFFNNRIF